MGIEINLLGFERRDVLRQLGIPEKVAEQYAHRFSRESIAKLYTANVPPNVANRYNTRFESWDIVLLQAENIDPDIANKFHEDFIQQKIIFLRKNGMAPGLANAYRGFNADEIVLLHRLGISPERAAKYDAVAHGIGIRPLLSLGLTPEVILEYKQKGYGMTETIHLQQEKLTIPERKELIQRLS